jgi:hypothetical protein
MANGTFSYGINTGNANPPIDYPRLLVADTVQFAADGVTPAYIFSDQEILAMEQIVCNVYQSGMFFSSNAGPASGGAAGAQLPTTPIPYYRVAAMLLQSLASNTSRLAGVKKLLDVELDNVLAAKSLRDQAAEYIRMDEESGAFVIIEQCPDQFSFSDRWFKQWQRQGTSY